MCKPILAAALVAMLTTPALAQVTVEDIGPNADRDFWCAAAFGIVAYTAQSAGDAAAAEAASANMTAIFSAVAARMMAQDQTKDDYDALVAQYTSAVMDPFARQEASYSREECDAAAAEVKSAAPPAE